MNEKGGMTAIATLNPVPLTLVTAVSMLALLLMGLGGVPYVQGHSGVVLSSFGTAKVDGVISPGEYGSCVGPITEGAYTFTICETDDKTNDYYALKMSGDTTPADNDFFEMWFDNTHDGKLIACTNGVEDDIWVTGSGLFEDHWYCYPPSGTFDTSKGGSTDGAGAVSETSAPFVFEISHPLSSGDAYDYSLNVGSTIGWCMAYLDSGAQVVQYPSGCMDRWESTSSSQDLFGDVVKADAAQVPVGGQLVAVDQSRIPLPWLALIALFGMIAVQALILNRRPKPNH